MCPCIALFTPHLKFVLVLTLDPLILTLTLTLTLTPTLNPKIALNNDEEYNGEGGPRRFGRLRCRYTSDPKYDCEPNIPVRRALRERFLCGTVTQI